MKKILFILVLVMTALVVNAQNVKVPASSSSVSTLPKIITDNVAKEHAGFTVKEATWDWSTAVVQNNIFIYEVVITNGTADETLIYDKDGKFLKKGVAKEVTVEKKDVEPEVPAQTPKKK